MITLKTLESATEQEVFDQVAIHLLTQRERSQQGVACLYRAPDGNKCAAGCLISDDEYRTEMENTPYQDIVNDYKITRKHLDLISNLQHLHDNVAVGLWRQKLKEIAAKRGLSSEKIKNFGK